MTALKVWWWRWKYPNELNFGDEVTAPLLERLTGRPVTWAPLEKADVVGAGSVLQTVMRSKRQTMPAVWGAGLIRPYEGTIPDGFIPWAVRGRLSSAIFDGHLSQGSTIALGDPGILANRLVDGPVTKKYSLGVIPHYKDVDDPTFTALSSAAGPVRRVDVAWTPEEVAREIASCHAVVSSSMHGLIFADSLGVPNARLKVSDKLVGGDYKFKDYASAFNGDRYQEPLRPEDVRDLSLHEITDLVITRYLPPSGIDGLRQGLVAALQV